MIGMLSLFFVTAVLPPEVDPHTGRIHYDFRSSHASSFRAPKALSEDTIGIRVYALGTESTLVWPYGIDMGQDRSKLWFLAEWIDTVQMTAKDFLVLLDPLTTPGVEASAVVRRFAVEPETCTAIHSQSLVDPFVSVASPGVTYLPADTFHGMSWWCVPGVPYNLDADGRVWFTESDSSKVACFLPDSGTITEWPVPTPDWLVGIHAAQDTTWYTNPGGLLGRLVPAVNEFSEWIVPGTGFWGVGWPGLDRDQEGNIWVARRRDEHFLARVKLESGNQAKFDMWTLPYELADGPCDLLVDRDGKVWYSVMSVDSGGEDGKIGRLDPGSGALTEWTLPLRGALPYYLELDGGGNCWFVEYDSNQVGMVNPNTNIVSEYTPLLEAQTTSYDLALDGAGNVWLTHGANCIVKFTGVAAIGEDATVPSVPARTRLTGSNIVRGTLQLSGRQSAMLMDISGNRKATLRPGANDIRHLPSGVYFVCDESGSAGAKVLVRR